MTGLVLVAVGLTTGGVALVAHALTGMPWAAAVALGALLAPPDATAATAVVRQVGLPHRIVTILEGESLLNDASALLIYRIAVTAMSAGSVTLATAAPTLLLSTVGSIIAGPILALGFLRLVAFLNRSGDAPTSVILQFIGTFGVWLLANRIGLSGILTIVAYAVTIARRAPATTPARLRVPSYAVWETAVFVLNVLAFVLIGLQIAPIVEGLAPEQRLRYLLIAAAALAAVILIRFAWVMSYITLVGWRRRRLGWHRRGGMMVPTVKGGLVVSWCGMRGIVTLVAALALPNGQGAAFPFRDLIVFVAFCVVLGTLVIQGLTLRLLLLRLNLRDDDPVGGGHARASARLSSRARIVGRRGLTTCRGAPRRVAGGACAIACARRRSGGRTGRKPAHARRRRRASRDNCHAQERRDRRCGVSQAGRGDGPHRIERNLKKPAKCGLCSDGPRMWRRRRWRAYW